MAKKPDAAAAAAPPAAGKKKSLLLIIVIVVVVLVAGGGAAAWFLLGHQKPAASAHDKEDKGDEHAEEEDEKSKKPPVFVTLEPFTVNLVSEGSDRYLQVGIDVKVSNAAVGDKIKVYLPDIRNGVLLLLTSKKVEEISTIEGKNRLREEIRDLMNKSMGYARGGDDRPAPPKNGVLDVLLTAFVIQ